MLQKVAVGARFLSSLEPIVGQEIVEELRKKSASVKKFKIAHINSTSFGGGVAEVLETLVPLMNDLGIETDWLVIPGNESFFKVTKTFHNALQGKKLSLITNEMLEIYNSCNKDSAEMLENVYDFIIVHDPQPAALFHYYKETKKDNAHLKKNDTRWIWRCHIDTSSPDSYVWRFLQPYIEDYEAVIFTSERFIPTSLKKEKTKIRIFPPAIDPLSSKNLFYPSLECKKVVEGFGVDSQRPLITQVSRFDPWKDPLGVIDVYRKVKEGMPQVQLALVGSMALDDPEGWEFYSRTVDYTQEDQNIHLLFNLGNLEVNAFQRCSDVVIQKSIKEGFGLVVSEALWKERTVVAAKVGGIPLQIEDGKNGFLVKDIADCAQKVLYLLENPAVARSMGRKGKETVKKKFLVSRLLRDYLDLLSSLKAGG